MTVAVHGLLGVWEREYFIVCSEGLFIGFVTKLWGWERE
jgi:hypothetical protein